MRGLALDLDALVFDDRGLLPVIAQDAATGAVLMLAWANREAVERTLATGQAHFWSRSRRALWRKGETSGNTLQVLAAVPDCDGDALLLSVRPAGPACHRGTASCFEPNPAVPPRLDLGWLWEALEVRRTASPQESYTARLLAAGTQRIAQKVGEEAVEVALAALAYAAGEKTEHSGEERGAGGSAPGEPAPGQHASHRHTEPGEGASSLRESLTGEAADLLYHLLVLLLDRGVAPEEVAAELARRHAGARRRPPVRDPGSADAAAPDQIHDGEEDDGAEQRRQQPHDGVVAGVDRAGPEQGRDQEGAEQRADDPDHDVQ
jgi:phosphoribosyl-ATP pyrophosphohydrolase/phosphoribosyl-AMP cyclohydrolase